MKRVAHIHVVIALALALVSLGGYVISYVLFSGARQASWEAEAEVMRIEEEDRAITEAQSAIQELETDEAILRSYFVEEEEIVGFLEELERVGSAQGSTIEVVSVTPASQADARLTLALRIEGSFSVVMRTLGSLEYGPWDIRTKDVTLDTLSDDESAQWTAAAVFTVGTITPLP